MGSPVAILPPLGILASLNDDERAELAPLGTVIEYRKADVILEQGQPQGFLRYVLEGELHVATKTETAIATLGYVHAGECVGEMSVLERVESMARVVTTTPARVWCLDRDNFERFCEQQAPAAVQLLKGIAVLLSRRLRAGDVRIMQAEENDAG
jgi:CRP/FNR family cyclic AMP-dependent transcriptional regulator